MTVILPTGGSSRYNARQDDPMPDRIAINRNEPVPLNLSAAERQILTGLGVGLVKGLRKTAPGQAALLSLEQLDELADQVADEAKQTKNRKLKATLRRIVDRIDETLESYVEFIPRPTGQAKASKLQFQVIEPTATPDSATDLSSWTTLVLLLAEMSAGQRRLAKVRIRRNIRLKLSAKHRALIVERTNIGRGLKTLLGSPDKAVEISIDDLAAICFGLAKALEDNGDRQDELEQIATRVAECLGSSLKAAVGELAEDQPKLKMVKSKATKKRGPTKLPR
jgi:hypothetical protein